MTLTDIIGLTGVACVLSGYFLLQIEKVKSDGLGYLLLNLFGALLLIVSLMVTFNLASFVIEICWLSISLFGLVKWALKRRRAQQSLDG
jgi:predicted membrane protein